MLLPIGISLFVYCSCVLSAEGVFLGRKYSINLHSTVDTVVTSKELSKSETQEARADEVRRAIRHLWSSYKAQRWGADEIQPISGKQGENWGGVGMLILDTLDTLWLAGLHKEFEEGEHWVSQLQLTPLLNPVRSKVFEITIRGLAGLLSAHALSGHSVFLEKARLLGDSLLQAFPVPGSAKGPWPASFIDVHNPSDFQYAAQSFVAEVGSNVLEFGYLSEATGDTRYERAAEGVLKKMLELSDSTGQPLAIEELDPSSLRFRGNIVSVGANADSYFEYLLKRYLQGGCQERALLATWKDAMNQMRQFLINTSPQGLTYIASKANVENFQNSGRFEVTDSGMEHLSCFVGGMLALASQYIPTEEVEEWWLPTGVEITRTCYEMYHNSPSGLAPEVVSFDQNGMQPIDAHYKLRPETLESLFYLYRITGNETYRDWSWDIFQAINNKTKTTYGFATVQNVLERSPTLEDKEETFMGAETLKYALLTQLPSTAMSLDKFVFNTEAHPLPAAKACREA